MATSLGFAWPVAAVDQSHTVMALEHLVAASVTSDRGTHFTGQKVQAWTHTNAMWWQLLVSYCPQTARMVEQFNGLLKDKLRALGPSWHRWMVDYLFSQASLA